MKPRISVIVPAYNEEPRIRENLLRVSNALKKDRHSFEIIAVDDGSTDRTRERMLEAGKADRHIKATGYFPNRGKGAAIKHGFYFAEGEIVAFLDADLEIPPTALPELLEKLGEGYDAAIFSKNHRLSRTNFPFYRRLLSKMFYLLAKALFRLPVSDTQAGCKAFRRAALQQALKHVYTKKFAFDLELLSYMNDYGSRIAELPIKIKFSREKGRIRLRNILRTLFDTSIAFYRLRIKQIHRWK